MPVATGTVKEKRSLIPESQAIPDVSNHFIENSQAHIARCSADLTNKGFSLYETYEDDRSSSVFFPNPTHSPSAIVFQLPANSPHSPPVTNQPQTSKVSQQFDTRDCSRRKLINNQDGLTDALCVAPSHCSTSRKSESPTRKRPRTSSCSESRCNSMFSQASELSLENRPISRNVSAMKKRVLSSQPGASSVQERRCSMVEEMSQNDSDLAIKEKSDSEGLLRRDTSYLPFTDQSDNESLFSDLSMDLSVDGTVLNTEESLDVLDEVASSHASAALFVPDDLSPPDEDDDVMSTLSEQLLHEMNDEIADEWVRLHPDGHEASMDRNFQNLGPETAPMDYNRRFRNHAGHSSHHAHATTFDGRTPRATSDGRSRAHERTMRHHQQAYVAMTTHMETTQHPMVIGLDRVQYTSALSVPVTVPSMAAFPVYRNGRATNVPCPIPPRVVAYPTQSAPVLTTCNRGRVNMQQPSLSFPEYRHVYPPAALSQHHISMSRQTQPNQQVHRARHNGHAEQSYSQRLSAAAMSSMANTHHTSMYPLPTLNPSHRPSNVVPPSQQLMFTPHGNNLHRLHNNGVNISPSRQPGLPRSPANVGHAPYAPPNHLLYGYPTVSNTAEVSTNAYIPNGRQHLVNPLQYRPSVHSVGTDASRTDPFDVSPPLGTSAVPPSLSAHAVAMPASYIPALAPPLYHDYASVEAMGSQSGHRAPPNHPLIMSHYMTPPPQHMAHGFPHFVAFHFPGLMFNPYLPVRPYVSLEDETDASNYEALLNLAERLGEAKPQGLSKARIEQLATYRYKDGTHCSDQPTCVVCMCEWEPSQLLRVLPCKHEFHAKCVDKWLKRNRTCPICRGDAGQRVRNSTATTGSRTSSSSRRVVSS